MSKLPANRATSRTANGGDVAAHELFLTAVNDGALYARVAKPIIANLARKMAAGTYDPAKAAKAWRYLADEGARAYTRDHGTGGGFGIFTPAIRDLAAAEMVEHYEEEVEGLAATLRQDAENRRNWTLSAVRATNTARGGFFFSRDTMRFFGDTVRSFAVRCEGGRIYVDRVVSSKGLKVGDRREFNPATGEIGPVLPR